MHLISPFKTYDIRGVYPTEINEEFAFLLGLGCITILKSKKIVFGYDARLSSITLAKAFYNGITKGKGFSDCLGLCGTEEVYFSTGFYKYDLGIMITGSHNPKNENGFKIIKKGCIPVDKVSELNKLENFINENIGKSIYHESNLSTLKAINNRNQYIKYLLDYISLKKHYNNNLKILIDAGNGCAGPVIEDLLRFIPIEIIKENFIPDGNFPNGVPNPLLPEKRKLTSQSAKQSNVNFAVAFDGDFDRCFFYDSGGNFIEGYYLVGLISQILLGKYQGETIIYDPRLYWNTLEIVNKTGGRAIVSRTGHAFMKQSMRNHNALYGGEMSAHNYFRKFYFCDSGILTMLFVIHYILETDIDLGEYIQFYQKRYPCSGEINFNINNHTNVIDKIFNYYYSKANICDKFDGINIEFNEWRFNLRSSNTEGLLRLNIETKGNISLLEEKTEEISNLIRQG